MLTVELAFRLKRLILSHNRFSSLAPSTPTASSRLVSLRHLSLASNLLSTWSSLDPLNALPSLESLRLADNPLLVEEKEERGGVSRLRVLGRVGRVSELEGSVVHPPERDDAERFYLAEIAREDGMDTDEKREKAHPRYKELVQSEFGTLIGSVAV